MEIVLSFGELFDKYQNNKYILLSNDASYFNSILCFVNKKLNDVIYKLHTNMYAKKGYYNLYKLYIIYQDAKFRIKNKINNIFNYNINIRTFPLKKCIVIPQLGLGDQFNASGMIRMLSIFYDDIKIADCENRYNQALTYLYKNDSSIHFAKIFGLVEYRKIKKDIWDFNAKMLNFKGTIKFNENDIHIIMNITDNTTVKDEIKNLGYDLLLLGSHYEKFKGFTDYFNYNFFRQVYDDCANLTQLPIFWENRYLFSYIPRNKEREEKEKEKQGLVGIDYIFLHDDENRKIPKILINNPNNYYIFNPCYNCNNDNRWKCKSSVLDCLKIIEDAKEIHVIDSCFYCLINIMEGMENKKLYKYGPKIYPSFTNPKQQWNNIKFLY